MQMLSTRQEMNIHSGETWKRMAERQYGANLPGLGAAEQQYGGPLPGLGLDVDFAPQQTRGVDTLMKVGDYVELDGDLGDFTIFTVKRLSAIAMFIHGYKRAHDSIFWGAVYAAFGYKWPPAAILFAIFAQGFAKPKACRVR